MGILDSLRGKQPSPLPAFLEPPRQDSSEVGIVFSPQDGSRTPRPESLPPSALWAIGSETRMSANEMHFPEVFRPLSIGALCAVELTRGRFRGRRKPIGASVNGASVGVFGYHPIRDQFAAVAKRGRSVIVPAMVEEVNGKKVLIAYMCTDTALAAWLHVHGAKANADYVPPTVEQSLGADGVRYDQARALLGNRGRHTFRATLAVEEVTQGADAGQSLVTVIVRSKRALELSPSQREHMPELFKAAERGARGALTVRVSSRGDLWGHIAAY
jgi:hypothetical protein